MDNLNSRLIKYFDPKSVLIFLAALAVRLAYIHFNSLGDGELVNDAAGYHNLACNLLERGTLMLDNGWRAHRMPGYPIFLSLIYASLGRHVFNIQLFQAILSSISCALLFRTAKKIVPINFAFVAGGIGCLYFDMFEGTARILSETLYIFFALCFLNIWLNESKNKIQIFSLGWLAGLGAMVRPEGILWGIAAWLVLIFKKGKQSIFYFLSFFFLVCLWGARNYLIFDRIILGTTLQGASIYYGIQRPLVELGKEPRESLDSNLTDEIASNDFFLERSKQVYHHTPTKRMVKIWLYGIGILFYPFRPFIDVSLILLVPLWLAGIIKIVQKPSSPDLDILLFVLGSIVIYTVLGGVAARYRQPFAPGLIYLSTIGITFLFEKLRRKVFWTFVVIWGSLILLIWPFASQLREKALFFKSFIW